MSRIEASSGKLIDGRYRLVTALGRGGSAIAALRRGVGRARALVAPVSKRLPLWLAISSLTPLLRTSRDLSRQRVAPLLMRLGPLAARLDPVVSPLLGRARPLLARIPVRPSGPVTFTAIAGVFIAAVLLLGSGSPVRGTGAPPTPVNATPQLLASASFAVPSLSSYAAAFVSQAPYPTVAPNGQVEWVVALRNTGSAGWYRGISGAQASLRLRDGTTAAVQSTEYVGPGQVGWFVARFQAPGEPGTHAVTLRPSIDGAGMLPDLGIHVFVTVRR